MRRLESVTVLRHYLLACWAVSRVSSWDPLILWIWLGGYARPNPHIISSRHHIRVMVLFKFSFYRKTESFIGTGSISPFTVIQGSHSCSTPLWRLVLLCLKLEPHIHLCFINICNFRLRVYALLLVFFDSLTEKAFLARSIKLCLVENQQSSGIMFAGLRIVSDQKPESPTSSLHQMNLPLPLERSSHVTVKWYQSFKFTVKYIIGFPFRLIWFLYLESTKNSKKLHFPLSYNPFVPYNFSVYFALLNLSPSLCRCVRHVQILFVVFSVNSCFRFAGACDCYTT